MKISKIKTRAFKFNGFRIDASFHLSDGVVVRRKIAASPYKIMKVGDAANQIFYGNRAKRVYVQKRENGIPFLSSSDILQADLENVKLASKKYTPCIEQMRLQEGWILISRSGTIGNTAWATKQHAQKLASEDVIRIDPNNILRAGFVYAYLSSSYGHSLLTQGTFGAVIQHIEPDFVASLPIPQFPAKFQEKVDNLIKESAQLREEANDIQKAAMLILYSKTGLNEVSIDEYNYFGPSVEKRAVSSFVINKKLVTPVTINAFNLSLRNRNLIKRIKRTIETKPLIDCLDENGLFSTGSFPRIELNSGHGVMLINQKDIFDSIIKGKYISKRNVKLDRLVEQNEIMIAGVGTLAETESFCRCIYANEYLKGKLVSGEFIRMKTNQSVMPGYLYLWLSSDYGFRLIRSTQAGTKLCRPIPKLLEQIPVPIIKRDLMKKINAMVLDSQNKLYQSVMKEIDAISLVEKEIDGWNA